MKQKAILLAVVLVLIGASFYAGYIAASRTDPNNILLNEARKAFTPLPKVSLPGEVVSIEKNIITIKSVKADPAYNPFDTAPNERKVVISSETVFSKRALKTEGEYNADMEVYRQKLMKDPKIVLTEPPPALTRNDEISFADIKVGDYILVQANNRIGNETEINAKSILVQLGAPYLLGEPSSTPKAGE